MFPNEVLYHIFSFLDHNALKTCLVVCPALAERHLYATITVRDCDPSQNSYTSLQGFKESEGYVLDPTALYLLINKNPRIAQYARTLLIDLPLDGTHKTSFGKLTRLESVTLSHRSILYQGSWLGLSSDFKSAFFTSLRFPCLKEVAILSIAGFPVSALLSCKPLKKLTIQAWDVNTETVPNSSQPQNEAVSFSSQYPQLETLELLHNDDVLETLISRANLTNLSHLLLTIAFNRGGNSILRLLQACSTSLKTLRIYCPPFHAKAHELHFHAVNQQVDNNSDTPITFPAHLLPANLDFRVYIPISIIRGNERYVSQLPTLSHTFHLFANDTSMSSREHAHGKSFSLSIYLHFVPRYSPFSSHQTRLELSPLILNFMPTSAKVIRRPTRIVITASDISGADIPAADVLSNFHISSELSSLIEEGVFVISGTERKRSWLFQY